MHSFTRLSIFFLTLAILIGSVSVLVNAYFSGETCTFDDWTCTCWSPEVCLLGGFQTRICTLKPGAECNPELPESEKPAEIRICDLPCIPNDWTCTAWSPEVCPPSGIQTRVCTIKQDAICNPEHPDSEKPAETTSCTPIEEPKKETSSELVISNLIPPDCVARGDEALLYVSVKNEGDEKIEDVKIIVTVQELGIRVASRSFTLKKNYPASRVFYFDIPYDAEPGFYYIRTSVVSSNEETAVKYRDFKVSNNC